MQTMNRRTVLGTGAAFGALALAGQGAQAAFAPVPGPWRRFEVTTTIDIARPTPSTVRAWIPVPAVNGPGWMRTEGSRWTSNAARAQEHSDPTNGAVFVDATWDADAAPASLKLVSVVLTRDRAIDLRTPQSVPPLSEADRARYTAATAMVPTDGIVALTAAEITQGATSDLDKARRIYDWIVENTARNPKTRGCGLGDVASMLTSGDLTGKCADLNTLYVGLARASGLPARDVYGIRVAPSAFGYKSLGANSPTITGAQHCRAEVYLDGFGWVPVDPADVRKVMLEEPPRDLGLRHPKVRDARAGLFGAWEGNWIAYNFAHDVALPGSTEAPDPFLMYPQAEIDGARQDWLDPSSFVYTITARELSI